MITDLSKLLNLDMDYRGPSVNGLRDNYGNNSRDGVVWQVDPPMGFEGRAGELPECLLVRQLVDPEEPRDMLARVWIVRIGRQVLPGELKDLVLWIEGFQWNGVMPHNIPEVDMQYPLNAIDVQNVALVAKSWVTRRFPDFNPSGRDVLVLASEKFALI